ncbi:MAG: hypothetical protein ACREHE_00925 [Rhizomicrobium sp.]
MTETPAEFTTRVAEVALKTGIKIKSFSYTFAANYVRGENANTAAMTDDAIAKRMIALAQARPDQVILLKPLARITPPQRETATGRLEKANAAADAAKPSEPQRTELTDVQRKWAEKYGAEAALDMANELAHTRAKARANRVGAAKLKAVNEALAAERAEGEAE